jgi:two-component system response regulator FixJ
MRTGDSVPTIAVVDDDEAIQHSISNLLRSTGYRCEVYGSAEELLDACGSLRPDCAIIDFRLPGLNGLELQRLLEERGHAIPVIMVTANEDRVRAQALELGAVAVLRKPFEGEVLLAAIRSALKHPPENKA